MSFSRSFEINKNSEVHFKAALPPRWLVREQIPDFYLDYIVEIDRGDSPSGMKFCVQLKGTETPKFSKDMLKFKLKTKHLKYFIDKISDPVFLVVVDVVKQEGYWVNLKEWAKGKDGWRGNKTVTVNVPKVNLLSNIESLRRAVEDGVEVERSLPVAAKWVTDMYEELDSRFSVKADLKNGNTHLTITPRSDVSGTMKFLGPTPKEKYSELIEKGGKVDFCPGELELEGSQVFKKILEEVGDERFSVQVARRMPCEVSFDSKDSSGEEEVLISRIKASLTGGTKEIRLTVDQVKFPLKFECIFPVSDSAALKQCHLSLNFDFWKGQELLTASYFDDMAKFFGTIDEGNALVLTIEHEGNCMQKGELNLKASEDLKFAASFLKLCSIARSVCRHLNVNPKFPSLSDFLAQEEELLNLRHMMVEKFLAADVNELTCKVRMSPAKLLEARSKGELKNRHPFHVEAVDAIPDLFGCSASEWEILRKIPIQLTRASENAISRSPEDEDVELEFEVVPGQQCLSFLQLKKSQNLAADNYDD